MIRRLGVLSDTHGRTASCSRAMASLRAAEVDAIVHLGDVGTRAVLEELVGEPTVHLVFGNCDDERELAAYAACLGLHVHHPAGRLVVAERTVAFTHGHRTDLAESIADGADLLLVGHTHRLADDRDGAARRVNPGALFRASRYTCCVIDGPELAASWIDVGRDPELRDADLSDPAR